MGKVNKAYVATAFFVVVVVGAWLVKVNRSSSSPAAETMATSSPEQIVTSSDPQLQALPIAQPKTSSPAVSPFSLVPGETIAVWDFAGTHNDDGQLEARVRAEIERTKDLLNSGTYTNYELYVSIANQYELLGDGKQEFTYLNYALAIDSEKTGLAWRNMGKLLERLGAYKSARIAYDRMVLAQPFPEYELTRLEFLKTHMPEDTDAIMQAEADLAASTN